MDEELLKEVIQLLKEGKYRNAELLLNEKKIKKIDENDLTTLLNLIPEGNLYRYVFIEKFVPNDERDKYFKYIPDVDKASFIADFSKEKLSGYIDYFKQLFMNLKSEDPKKQKRLDGTKHRILSYSKSISDSDKMELIKYIDDKELKIDTIFYLSDKNKLKYIINNYKSPYNNEELYEIIAGIKDENIIKILLFSMKVLNKDYLEKYREDTSASSIDFIRKNIFSFIELEVDDKNEVQNIKNGISKIIDELSDFNLRKIDFNILSSKFVGKSNMDEVLMFILYNETKEIISLSDKEIKILFMCIEHYKATTASTNWNNYSGFILENLKNKQFEELINSIENIDELNLKQKEILYKILQSNNYLNLTNISQLDNYEKIKENKCTELFNSDNIDNKRNAIFIKLFGIDLEYAKNLIIYSEESSFENTFLKSLLEVIKRILVEENEEVLNDLFYNQKIINIDKTFIEDKIRTEYGKMYNNGLFVPTEATLISKEKNMYDAGTDFRIILSVIGEINNRIIDNYYDDWNRKINQDDSYSNMFCASYITFNCLGKVGSKGIIFGFYNLDPSTMVGCYQGDGGTHSSALSSTTQKLFKTPTSLVKNTGKCFFGARYNEINYLRFSNNKRQQPDYLIAFKVNGIIENEKNILEVQKQFFGIPIVVIDVNKCIEKTKQEVLNKIEEFKKNPSKELYEEIKNEIVRNRKICYAYGLDEFLPNIDIVNDFNIHVSESKKEIYTNLKDSIEEMKKYLDDEKKEFGI